MLCPSGHGYASLSRCSSGNDYEMLELFSIRCVPFVDDAFSERAAAAAALYIYT